MYAIVHSITTVVVVLWLSHISPALLIIGWHPVDQLPYPSPHYRLLYIRYEFSCYDTILNFLDLSSEWSNDCFLIPNYVRSVCHGPGKSIYTLRLLALI